MTSEEKIENEVRQAKDKVLLGGYDYTIIDDLCCLNAFLDPLSVGVCEHNFETLSRTEMRKFQNLLKKELIKEINKKEISFLQTMRIVLALQYLPGKFLYKKHANKRIQFCIEFYRLSGIEGTLEAIGLLDQI